MRTGDAVIVRDGHGTGEAHGDFAGEVHDRALKAAETDATKRALATFGKAFGLALYAGTGRAAEMTARADTQQVRSQREQDAEPQSSGAALPPPVKGSTPGHPTAEPDAADGAAVEGGQRVLARVDKSTLSLSEPRRLRDKEHLRFVASQPCLLCSAVPCDAHHLRFSQPRALGRKVGDDFTVPLCRQHHRDLHDSGNEAAWWHDMGIDALEIAKDLWNESMTARAKAVG